MSVQSWFADQTPREQLIVVIMAVVAVVAAGYLLVFQPLTTGIAKRQSTIASQQKDLQWMKQQESLVQRRPGAAGVAKPIDKAPYILLDEAIRRASIKAPDRVTPDGSQGARAQFSEVEFDKLLQVLGGLEQTYRISVKTINVSKKSEGLVSARLSLEVDK